MLVTSYHPNHIFSKLHIYQHPCFSQKEELLVKRTLRVNTYNGNIGPFIEIGIRRETTL